MAVSGIGSTTSVPVVPADQIGFAGLTADSFLKLLITQLKSQDPLEPMGNEELLNQLAMMRNLQSSVELSTTLKGLIGSQELSTAASFIGQSITGLTTDKQTVSGIADRVFMSGGKVFLGIGNQQIPYSQITGIQSNWLVIGEDDQQTPPPG
jgi:flagellar basal-body rod modification protein FlgD